MATNIDTLSDHSIRIRSFRCHLEDGLLVGFDEELPIAIDDLLRIILRSAGYELESIPTLRC